MSNQPLYRVGPKGGVSIGARYFAPNVVIPNDALNEKTLASLLREHVIVRIGEVLQSPKVEKPQPVGIGDAQFFKPGSTKDASIGDPTGADAAERARKTLAALAVARAEGTVPEQAPVESVEIVREEASQAAPASPWTHDPDGLVGQPIDDLRKLVLDVDPTIEVTHLDEVELIAVLSSDFKAPANA